MLSPGLGRERDIRREFEALALPLQRDLYAFAFRLTGRREDAEDLAQDALVRAFKAFPRFEPRAKFKTWLFRIATNLYINDYRKRARRPPGVPMEDFEGEEREIPDDRDTFQPEARLLSAIDAEELWREVSALAEPFRVVLILCDVEEMTYEEAAATLKVPIGTVRSRLFRARRQIRQRLSALMEPQP